MRVGVPVVLLLRVGVAHGAHGIRGRLAVAHRVVRVRGRVGEVQPTWRGGAGEGGGVRGGGAGVVRGDVVVVVPVRVREGQCRRVGDGERRRAREQRVVRRPGAALLCGREVSVNDTRCGNVW